MKKAQLLFFIFSFFIGVNSALAQEIIGPIREMFRVDSIEFTGNRKVESEAILEKIGTRQDMMLDNYLLRKDLSRIYEMKYFEEVEAYHKITADKNILLFKLKEKPIISKITFSGNDEINDDDLKEQIKTKEFNILDISTLKNDVLLLQKHYEEKGYFLALASYTINDAQNGSVEVKFKIKEWDKVRVKKITFLGNKDIKDDELKNFMQTREESYFSFLSGSGNFKEINFQTDVERLKYYYKTRGYLQINIQNPEVTASEDKKWIFITVRMQEGPQFSVNNISFNGELLFTEEEMMQKLKLKSGDIYNEENLRQDIQTLTEMYQDKGYAFANVLRTLEVVPGENKVDVVFSFEKGVIAYFGKITMKGNTKTRDKVIRRELRIHEGEMYSGSKLRISKENVNRLGFFQQESVIFNTITRKGTDNVLDVEVSIKERPTGQISLGAGYSTATKGFVQASVAQNNFRGLGQNINMNLSYSNRQQIYNVGFTEPYLFDTKWTAGADYYQTVSYFIRSFVYKKHGGDVRVGHPIFEYTRLFLTYRYEDNRVDDVINEGIDPKVENGSASSLQASIIRDKRNNIFEPTNGYYTSGALEYTGLGGTMRWMKAEVEGRYYRPIIGDLVLRTRVNGQQLFKTTSRDIPRVERFSMGGARNMRGFNLEDIGPRRLARNTDTKQLEAFNFGGLFSFLTTVELEHPIVKEAGLKWVVFYDTGNVWDTRPGINNDYSLRANYGFGFRWFSPIGVLRFEFGFPVNPRKDRLGVKGDNEAGNQFNFDIGQLF
ncbi:outer membrane protein assembly factor BamA [Peredibacter starrii]|uniref:Outer membrane protein assembly factor BamA n=1 Tax=Peredibacter starrii TaxID=28202 RepID=A0AAX4HNF9_9BACT|nr:outer membrane protein assembly factor BamA [Peredibacter starrii]WPU64681.1 outer membrane protein assembly factor BamA [Peredibacter starrii]